MNTSHLLFQKDNFYFSQFSLRDSHKKKLKSKLNVKNSEGMVRRGFELRILRRLANQASLILLLIMMMGSISVSGQSEVELRTDGIVVPKTATTTVNNPVEGMIIYDINVEAFMYYNGSDWSVVGGGAFERVNGVVRPASPKAETDSFEFGGSANGESSIAFGMETEADSTSAVAFGNFTKASGLRSTALGYNTKASGGVSTAFGHSTEASGENSTAFGFESLAFGVGSTSLGNNTSAIGIESTSFGNHTVAWGDRSLAFGSESLASNTRATAFGLKTEAAGESSTAFGDSTLASGIRSLAIGHKTIASGENSTAFGFESLAHGEGSTSFGYTTTASASNSTAFGSQTQALSTNSVAFGSSTTASGDESTSFGQGTTASGPLSTAFGRQSVAAGIRSTAAGNKTIANARESFVIGAYNDSLVTAGYDDADRPLFVIGNGNSSLDRNNALVVRNNGIVEFDNYIFPRDDGTSGQVMTTDGNGQLSWNTLLDNDPNNEKQSLSLSGNALRLSKGGGLVDISYLDDWRTGSDGSSLYFNVGQGGGIGNVGIGSINPDARLEVYSLSSSVANPTLELTEDSGNQFVHQAFSNRFANEKWLLKAKPKDANSSSSAAFNFAYTEGDKNIISLKGDGSVGIGMNSTFDNTYASARLEIQANSQRSYATLQLHETQNDFVRQSFSNTGSNEKWFFTVDPNNDPSLGVFNIYHTDDTGGTNALKLFGDGDAIIKKDLTVMGTYNPSDIRYKKNIISLGGTLSSISKLGGYRYNWKDENKPEPQIGLIAQEVQAVYPELVKENEDGMLSVSYTKMVPILLEAIKEQQRHVQSLEKRLEKLEDE